MTTVIRCEKCDKPMVLYNPAIDPLCMDGDNPCFFKNVDKYPIDVFVDNEFRFTVSNSPHTLSSLKEKTEKQYGGEVTLRKDGKVVY